jgi:dienelactone hydrolase
MKIDARGPRGPRWIPIVLIAAALAGEACATPVNTPAKTPTTSNGGTMSTSIEDRAKTFVGELAKAEWSHPKTAFDPAMSKAASDSMLRDLWSSLERGGAFVEVKGTRRMDAKGLRVVLVDCVFGGGQQTLRLVFDEGDRLAGLFLETPKIAWSPPAYVDLTKLDERELDVGTAPVLPGWLTVPKGPGPHPAIVLVHGSGPNDQDETVGAVKPFKDLAWGLASRGVAVLRYVKRSRVSRDGIVTQRDEAEDPARGAVALLKKTPGVDPKRVFLLGHSQGGYLAPRIAKGADVAGVVILAGSTRPLQDSLVEQLEYFATTLSPENVSLRATLEAARAYKAHVESPSLRPEDDVPFPLGGVMKGAYYLDVRGYDPAGVARTLDVPLLVLQGERDYQVTMTDFAGWKAALSSRPKATLRTYPTLNHLFVSGQGTPNPSEYDQPGHVDEEVIGDIAAWVAKRSTPGEAG